MNAGKLKDIITVEEPITIKDEYGASSVQWNKVITTRAYIPHTNGSRTIDNYETFHSYLKTFEVRIYHAITETMRIGYDGKYYRILAIDPDRDRQRLIINTELINE